MKALRVEMFNIEPMTRTKAKELGLRYSICATSCNEENGYAISYKGNSPCWKPASEIAKKYFLVSDDSKILEGDINNFIIMDKVLTLGDKTTLVHAHTITGLEYYETSSCVDPKNYDLALGTKYALERITSKVRDALEFVLQWAKNGINI